VEKKQSKERKEVEQRLKKPIIADGREVNRGEKEGNWVDLFCLKGSEQIISRLT